MDHPQQPDPGTAPELAAPGGHDFAVVDSEVLVEAPILALRRDLVRMPGGRIAAREVVEHFGAVAVVALDGQGRVALLRQWRQAAGDRLLELPAGLLDLAGEEPLAAARRELAEEAGLAADRWSLLTDFLTSPGFAEEAVRVLLAEGITEVARPGAADDEEADLQLTRVPLAEAAAMCLDGRIRNGIAVAGILAAARVVEQDLPRRPADAPFGIRPTTLARRRARLLGGGDLKRVPGAGAGE